MNRRIGKLLVTLGLAATALALSAAPALAAPEFDVTLERDLGPGEIFDTVYHSDERVDFTVEVANVAPPPPPPAEGDTLSCATDRASDWLNDSSINYSFEFRWLRDGTPITGWAPADKVFGDDEISTYTLVAADAEKPIQCLVKATNGASTGSYVGASLPAVVADPQPAVDPPEPNSLDFADRSPPISGTASEAGDKLTCTAPSTEPGEGWSESHEDSPIEWSFEWIRDGEPAPGTVTPGADPETESEYELIAEDVGAAAPAVFECLAKATNEAGHSVVTHSLFLPTTAPAPEFVPGTEEQRPRPANSIPSVENAANTIASPVTLEVELPAGQETFAYRIEQQAPRGWSCEAVPAAGAQPARAVCQRASLLGPGEQFPTVKVITALGADAPDFPVVRATAFGGGAAPASDELDPPLEIQPAKLFGLETFTAALLDGAGEEHVQAGGHPFRAESELALTRKRALVEEGTTGGPLTSELPIEELKRVVVEVPPGVTGNPLAVTELCPDLNAVILEECPPASQVGQVDLVLTGATTSNSELFAIEPDFGSPAQFAFRQPVSLGIPNVFVFDARLRPEDGYAVNLELAPAPEVRFLGSTVNLCSLGARPTGGCREAGEPSAFSKPLLTAPTRCGVPLETRVRVNSWDDPTFVEDSFANASMTDCHEVPFEPTSDLRPTSGEADSPTGFEVELSLPPDGLEDPEGISQSHLRKAEVTLPEGMAVNPSAAQGLGACSEGQIKLGTNEPISCPQSSKIGAAEIETPILDDTLKGAVYIAEQGAVDGSLLGIYLVFESPENGILVKQAAKVTPDPRTGQLVVTVAESPQQPFSSVKLSFPGGDRATLLTPPRCGTYEIENKLTPWSGGPPVTQTSEFRVSTGPNGGPCPTDALLPALHSGVTSPLAGQPSPFAMRLHRPDGSDRFKAISIRPPEGLIAKLKGLPYCSEAQIGLARSRSGPGGGQDELDSRSCPAASQIGRVIAGAGAGPDPFYTTTARAYLAGPHMGAPLSIVVIAPAVAGPLDLGNVVVRNAVHIDPATAKISVVSDPIPHILHGLLLDIRDVRVLVDRPDFTRNPTDCSPMRMGADVRGLIETAIARPSNHFQVGNCAALGFKPRASIQLFGKTNRGAYQGVRAVVRPRPGDANISRTVVRFPRSAFIAQEHLRNVCTRVQYAADACPKGSIYGKAVAWSPLLDLPLRGNVYLRSSDNELPDLVADLRGPAHQPIRVEVAVRNDAVKGALRNTVQAVPDAPVSYVRLQVFGGSKGLIVNSRNICRGRNQARVGMNAHNGRRSVGRVNVFNRRCAKQRKARRKAKRRAARQATAKRNRLALVTRSGRAG